VEVPIASAAHMDSCVLQLCTATCHARSAPLADLLLWLQMTALRGQTAQAERLRQEAEAKAQAAGASREAFAAEVEKRSIA